MNQNLGSYFRMLRSQRSATLHDISKITDIDSPLLSKIERGERLPTFLQLSQLAQYYQVEESSLKAKLMAEKIIKDYGLNNTTQEAIRIVEEQLEEYRKTPFKPNH
ncbi:MAG: helix-turn-helix transcriptional regulator [Chitinophagales bacterium]|nr:helix-turn-helix transcriptional regulator [Chitinophagales bacterium]